MSSLRRTSLRLSLQFAFLYSVLSALVFVLAYWVANYEVRDHLLEQMQEDAIILSEIYKTDGIAELLNSVNVMANVNFENARIFQLFAPDGSVLAGNISSIKGTSADGYISVDRLTLIGAHEDEISGYWTIQTTAEGYTLLQGTGDHIVAELLEAMALSLLAGFILIMGLGTAVGVWVGRLTERRLESISGTLQQVASGNLTARIPTDERSNDDLTRVSSSINRTLRQLENLMESQVQITNDIAHDLRTPLQRLRQRLEKMAGTSVIDPEDANAALDQTENVIETFNGLLRIAQIEAGDLRESFQATDLCDLLTTVHEAYEPAAEDAGQVLTLKVPNVPILVQGDANLLMQLISNLVENALRHSFEGTTIELQITLSCATPVLSVSDDGPGIAEEYRDKVLERFFREEKSRTAEGNGLGLSLVKAISDLHHTTLHLSDNAPGLRVEARFLSIENPPSEVNFFNQTMG